MGVGGKKPSFHEIDDTRNASRDEAFEEILRRIKSAGGSVTKDETAPLYVEIGTQQFEIGTERIVEFTLGANEFLLIRRVENSILQGATHQKHVEPLTPPRIKISLKKRSLNEDDYVNVDLEDMF